MARATQVVKTRIPLTTYYEFEITATENGYTIEAALTEAIAQWMFQHKKNITQEVIEQGGTALQQLEEERLKTITSVLDRLRQGRLQEQTPPNGSIKEDAEP